MFTSVYFLRFFKEYVLETKTGKTLFEDANTLRVVPMQCCKPFRKRASKILTASASRPIRLKHLQKEKPCCRRKKTVLAQTNANICKHLSLVKMKPVAFLKHLVYMVGNAVLALLHEFELADIRLQQGRKLCIG